MGTVTIAESTFTVYGTLATAKIYYLAAMGAARVKWDAASDEDKSSALVNATRLIDRQQYIDIAATPTLRAGIALFETACYELAGMLIVDSTLMTQISSGSNVKIAKSGGDEVEFFEPTLYITGRFPINIMELIGEYLGTTPTDTQVSGSYATGTGTSCDDETLSYNNDRYGITRGT